MGATSPVFPESRPEPRQSPSFLDSPRADDLAERTESPPVFEVDLICASSSSLSACVTRSQFCIECLPLHSLMKHE